VHADLPDAAQAEAMVRFAVVTFGGLHILYNNAGIPPEDDAGTLDTPEATWDRVHAVNLKGVWLGDEVRDPRAARFGQRHDRQPPARVVGPHRHPEGPRQPDLRPPTRGPRRRVPGRVTDLPGGRLQPVSRMRGSHRRRAARIEHRIDPGAEFCGSA
jgi:NAD(P)-dependent dehydrogenase (short-subunit alcohol dehydrogenase family)